MSGHTPWGVIKREKWDRRFLKEAQAKAEWSKDRSTKHGGVVVRERRILAPGYNGFPEDVVDGVDERHERPRKYLFTEHAERNALYQAARFGTSLDGASLYVTGPPCADCVRGIIQSGIREVIWPKDNGFEENPEAWERWRESCEAGFKMMEEADVAFRRIPKRKA